MNEVGNHQISNAGLAQRRNFEGTKRGKEGEKVTGRDQPLDGGMETG